MVRPEILAPVGGQEQLIAAVRCGADAVYLGAKGFNARRNAENFEESSLRDTVAYCHARGVKVHVTVNTLVMDSELKELEKTAEEIAEAGADAVIVQDLAVMRLFLRRYPTLAVHASTQCAVHNTDGVRFFEDMGVSRVVLARELSLKEIEKIRAATGVELEAFVHGALCMCLSGACYLSGMIGGRSGNRGLCAQPCRLDFMCGGHHYALSLKDMSHLSYVRALSDAGVCSLKIEGRMKRPEYVAAAVSAARNAVEGRPYDAETLRAVFSRAGFTDGYLTGKRTHDMFGHRGKDDVTAAAPVLKELARLYDKEQPRVAVDMALEVGEKSRLTASALGKSVTVEGGAGIPAENRPTDEAFARRSLAKCGGTPFYLDALRVENPDGLMLPPSVMNAMRRDALSALDGALSATAPHRRENYALPSARYTPPETMETWARFQSAKQLFEEKIDRIILPIGEIAKNPELIAQYGDKLTGELPAALFPEDEDAAAKQLESLAAQGLASVWAENAYGITLAERMGLRVYGGAGLNILNTPALMEYEARGLSAATVSFELMMSKIGALGGGLPRGYIAYGRLPVMRVRSCPARGAKGCGDCDGRPHLTDRTGAEEPIICHERKFQTILNSVPLHLGGKPQAKCDFRLLYFTIETRAECAQAAEEIVSGIESAKPRTGGLYYRALK